jgi:putative heme-binding domain-containing protein
MKKRSLRVAGVVLANAIAWAATWSPLRAQERKNPSEGNAQAIADGRSSFRLNCAQCHGLNAMGGSRAPSLAAGAFRHGGSDANLFATILQGVPGTLMPANDLTDEDTWTIVAFLRSIQPKTGESISGDAPLGKRYFFGDGHCDACHMVNGRGGRLGPDLTRVGTSRPAAYIIESIRQPDKELADGLFEPNHDSPMPYDTATVTLRDGTELTGVAKNEDSFTIELMTVSGEIHSYVKQEVQNVAHERKSLMPPYGKDQVSDQRLQDLLAYFQSVSGK